MADVDTDGAPWPEFKANGASDAMGPPIETVPGAGTLRFDGSTVGLWSYGKSEGRLRVTLQDFHVVNPAVAQSPDLVGPHAVGRSGQPDHVGQIVLRVEEHVPRPPELALWLRTAAGVTVGTGEGEPAWPSGAGRHGAPPPPMCGPCSGAARAPGG